MRSWVLGLRSPSARTPSSPAGRGHIHKTPLYQSRQEAEAQAGQRAGFASDSRTPPPRREEHQTPAVGTTYKTASLRSAQRPGPGCEAEMEDLVQGTKQ